MIDLATVHAAFPELTALVPLAASGQRDVLRGQQAGTEIVSKIVRAASPDAEARILREVEAVSALAANYIPTIYSFGRRLLGTEERLFIIEQYTPGETYRQVLQREPLQSLAKVLSLADVLLGACRDFEAARLVHRDIKPENLIIGTTGQVWTIDFGIVRMLDLASITPTVQPGGSFTPGYGAPEQMRNMKPKIDARADLFSIGIVLYESLAGRNPHRAGATDQLEVMRRVESQELPRLAIANDTSGELSAFLASLVSRFPSRRPQTAAEAWDWFREVRQKIVLGP